MSHAEGHRAMHAAPAVIASHPRAHLLRKVAELLPLLHARARQAALEHLAAVDLQGMRGAGKRTG